MYEFSVQERKINMNLNFTDIMSHALIGIMTLLPIHLLQCKSIRVYSEENWSKTDLLQVHFTSNHK